MVEKLLYVIVSFNLFPEHFDADESKTYFEANFSHVYFILYDNFILAENNLRQRGKQKCIVLEIL